MSTSSPIDSRRTRLRAQTGSVTPTTRSPGQYPATLITAGPVPGTDLLLPKELLERVLPQFLGLGVYLHPTHCYGQDDGRLERVGCLEEVRYGEERIEATLRLCAVPAAQWIKSLIERQTLASAPEQALEQAPEQALVQAGYRFTIWLEFAVLDAVESDENGLRAIRRILDVRRTLMSVHHSGRGPVTADGD